MNSNDERAMWVRRLTNPDSVIDGEHGPMVPLSIEEAHDLARLLAARSTPAREARAGATPDVTNRARC